jgi:hypothetical protein
METFLWFQRDMLVRELTQALRNATKSEEPVSMPEVHRKPEGADVLFMRSKKHIARRSGTLGGQECFQCGAEDRRYASK